MSDLINPNLKRSIPKKQVLGRGLGSLLGEKSKDNTSRIAASKEEVSVHTKNVEVQINLPPNLPPAPLHKTNASSSQGFLEGNGSSYASPAPTISDHARIWKIDIDKIQPNIHQPRQVFINEPLKELAASIKEKGILQPIVVRKITKNQFEIIAGERRWRAAQLAGLHQIPVIIKETDDQESLELALIENIQRADLNPVEEAEAYAHLIKKYQLTQQRLAEKIGKDRVTIANTMRLLNLAPEVRDLLSKGDISLGQAKVLLSIEDNKLQYQLANKVKNEKLSVRATERLVLKSFKLRDNTETHLLEDSSQSGITKNHKAVLSIADDLQKLIGTKVSIDYKEGNGSVLIRFYSDAELNNIIEKLRLAWQK